MSIPIWVFCLILIGLGIAMRDLAQPLLVRYHEWRFRRTWARLWVNRPRGTITKIGRMAKCEDCGGFHPEGFEIRPFTKDGKPVPIISISPEGERAWAGYTDKDLAEVAEREKEFAQ